MSEQTALYSSYMYSYPHKTAYRTLHPPVSLGDRLKALAGREASLYFHIPFCRTKCGYCNLFSQQTCDASRVDDYLNALDRQAEQLSSFSGGLRFTSFALGGGTPLLLSNVQLERLFQSAERFGVSPSQVFTSVETSPDYTSPSVLQLLREYGVERLSIGVQSFDERELRALKRSIAPDTIREALEQVSLADFRQFNIDLIYGVEGQTVNSFLHSLNSALSYHPNEMFIYPLYVRQGTGIHSKLSEDACLEIYNVARQVLLEAGFMQTSMRRFVRRDTVEQEFSCGDEVMLSCGSGGRSYLGDLHVATPYAVRQTAIRQEIDRYIATTDFTVANNGVVLSADEQRRRFLIKNLMYYRGVDIAEYEQRFGRSFPSDELQEFFQRQWIEEQAGYVRLTPSGMACSDYIGQCFTSPSVRELMDGYVYP